MSEPFKPMRFWRQWIVANACAELIGLGTVAGLGYLVAHYMGEPGGITAAITFAVLFVALGAIEGFVVGIAQSSVLRRALPDLSGWMRATVIGAAVSWAIGMAPSTVMSALPQQPGAAPPEIAQSMRLLLAAGLGFVAGPLLAFFQWRQLRRSIARGAWWWLPANGMAWALGMPVIFYAAHLAAKQSNVLAVAGTVGVALLFAGAVVGAVHGGALTWLIAHRT